MNFHYVNMSGLRKTAAQIKILCSRVIDAYCNFFDRNVSLTVKSFLNQNEKRATIYRILNEFINDGKVEKKQVSRKKRKQQQNWLKKSKNNFLRTRIHLFDLWPQNLKLAIN